MSVTLSPDSAVLGATDSAAVVVILRNTTDTKPVSSLRLSLLPNDAVRGRFDSSMRSILAGGETFTTILHITRIDSTVRPVAVAIRTDARPGGVVVTPFHVSAGAYTSPEQVGDVQLVGGAATVTSNDRSVFYVVVRNKTDSSIRVGPLTTAPSANLTAGVDTSAHLDANGTVAVPPRGAATVPMFMTGVLRPTPGKETLVVTVPLHWTIGHSAATGALIATRDVEVDVWGESDLLKVLGVPSFLVLPGFLVLVTFGLLWKFRKPWRSAPQFSLSPMTPEFWLFGITLSGAFALVAPLAGIGNYLHNYDITDIAGVWLASIALPAAVYGVLTAVGAAVDRSDDDHRRAITPLATDGVIAILRRLAADRRPMPTTIRTIGEHDERVFELRNDPADASKVWVAPPALVKWATAAAPTADQATDEARLSSLIVQPRPDLLADFLEKYRELGRLVEVGWDTSGTVATPKLVDGKDLKNRFTGYLVTME